jgi:hypothetical protein
MSAKMSYYIYENWTAAKKAVIHDGSCRHCNNGKGCHENPLGNKNGKWHGPFDNLKRTQVAAKATGRPIRKHRCVK